MIMGTDDWSVTAGHALGSITGLALGFVAGPAPDFVTNPASGSVTGPALDAVTGPAPGIIAGRIAFVEIDISKGNYFYGKQVTAEDLTSSKLYMKGTIWIRGIPFGETSEA